MPYLKSKDKNKFKKTVKEFSKNPPTTAGEINYLVTELVYAYLNQQGLNYQHLNDIVGALDGAKVELQRRIVGPYEDLKIKENGDVGFSLKQLLKKEKKYR